jgi:hypothetical protein
LQGPYLAQQTLENVSTALAEASGDWTGPNADGTPNTWHWVGTSQASSTTAFDANSYTVTAAGSFAYELNTTAEFVDPGSSTITPSGAASYRGFFELHIAAQYRITAQLNPRGRVRLSSFEGLEVFDRSIHTDTVIFLDLAGTIPDGHYQILASTSLAASNLPNGVHRYVRSGSFENMTFTVQIPEPAALGALLVIVLVRFRSRPRSIRALVQ